MNWLRKVFAQMSLSRSDAALIKSVGGVPREVRGMVLDPRFQVLEDRARQRPDDFSTVTPEQRRARTANLSKLYGGARVSQVRTERIFVTGRSHSVPGRLYLPRVRDNRATMLVYFHLGGGVVGSVENCDRLCGLIARAAGAPVLSVEYRLAPEYRFPAGLEDATAAYVWAVENASRFGARSGKAAVGGDSIGANFAATIAQECKLHRRPQPALQLLIYPLVDFVSDSASMSEFADAYPLTADLLAFFLKHYLAEDIDPAAPRVSPAHEADVSGLAPALVYTAGFDMLLDQGEGYADRLSNAGVKVKRARFESLPHAFVAMPAASPAAEAALQRIAAETADALRGKWD